MTESPETHFSGLQRQFQDREYARRLSAGFRFRNTSAPAGPACRAISFFSPPMPSASCRRSRKLTPAQAMYHFLSGYTAKVASTEGPGGRAANLHLLRRAVPAATSFRLRRSAARIDSRPRRRLLAGRYRLRPAAYRRRPAGGRVTRTLLTAALDGSLECNLRTDPYFGFSVPTQLTGVEPHLLYPQKTWQNKLEFDQTAPEARWHCREELRTSSRTMLKPTCAPPRRKCGWPRISSANTTYFQDRNGVSGTSVSGGLPAAQARMLSAEKLIHLRA